MLGSKRYKDYQQPLRSAGRLKHQRLHVLLHRQRHRRSCHFQLLLYHCLGTAQGKQARTITAGNYVTIHDLGDGTEYDVSGITAYPNGIKYNYMYYAGNGDAVSLTLSRAEAPEGSFFIQYTVTGGGTLANPTTNNPTLTMTDAYQTINVEWAAITQTFNYTGAVQTYTVPTTGYYTLTCYGAQGGFSSNGLGGKGGLSQLTYPLTQGDVLYIYVGGQGGCINDYSGHPEGGDGGWNGGGKGGTGVIHQASGGGPYSGGGGGGGATHIATSDIGPITGSTDFTSNHANLLLIAGGGGGGLSWGSNAGGAGGGAEGGKGRRNGEWNIAWNNGTLSCGKDGMTSSTGSGSAEGCGGGGAGYVGGNTWTVTYNANDQSYSGAGGSSWGETTNGINYSTTSGGATEGGNGKAVITLLLQGSGTAEDPYLIPSVDAWNFLADQVNAGNTFSGKFFLQTANISVTTMMGIDATGHQFGGTYDGGGYTISVNLTNNTNETTAPFRYIRGATIKNLHTTGSINTNQQFAGGIVGRAVCDNTIINCSSNVFITTTLSGDGTDAGLVGLIWGDSQNNTRTTLKGCAFTGKLLGSSTHSCGGLVGWCATDQKVLLTIEDCLYAPQERTIGESGSQTFSRGHDLSKLTITNSYYSEAFGGEQGKQRHSISAGTGVTVANAGTETEYNVSGITSYGTGIKYGEELYAGNGDAVSLNLTATAHDGYSVCGYIADDVTLTGSGNPYTLAMPASDATINARYSASKVINKYTSNTNGWYLIASPMTEEVNPENVTDMTINTYDIFRFNQRAELEWENWEQAGGHYHFNLERGMGYLYANSEDVELVFIGTPYNGNGIVNIRHHDTNPDPRMRGWNLIGNPFGVSATIPKDCYKMKDTHDEVILCESPVTVDPMEGVFVYSSHSSEDVTFTPVTQSKSNGAENNEDNIVINLSGNDGSVIDRAIVSFDEGHTLPKFQIRDNSTKLYIPKGEKDYAIAYSDGQGEMPLNFKAAESGEYTLTVSAPLTSHLSSLTLIDNLTGVDIDLLATPTYTFTARKDDYASRFRLVFSANENDNGNEDFAFISDGDIIINGAGTLQVIDLLGRQLFTCEANSEFRIPNSAFPAGVYVLRLINGENVKTQKIVIRH